jgi:hypothetical protein
MACLVRYMTLAHRRDVLEGTLANIALDKLGKLPALLAERRTRVVKLLPPYRTAAIVVAKQARAAHVDDVAAAKDAFTRSLLSGAPGNAPAAADHGVRVCVRAWT